VDAEVIVNAIVVRVVVCRSVTDSDMSVEVVPDVNTHGASAARKTDDCDIGGCPTGFACPNKGQRGRVVGEYKSAGG
jgi:hypothetical protein